MIGDGGLLETRTGARRAAGADAAHFLHTAHHYYQASRMAETVRHFRRARDTAMAAGIPEMEEEARFWEGASLHGAGRIEEALATWAPVLSASRQGPLSSSRYMIITRYLLVAIEIPLPLDLLEQAIEQVSEAVGAGPGGTGRRSRVLLARARLAQVRGDVDEAVELGQEALVRSRREHPTYTLSTYYRTLVRAGLQAGKRDEVEDWIESWESTEFAYPDTKRIGIATARAELARLRGDGEAAIHHLEAVVTEAQNGDEAGVCAAALTAFIRGCIAAGVPDAARSSVRSMLRYRQSPIGGLRFESHLLRAEYHAAMSANGATAEKHARGASRAFDAAARDATFLDEQLRTTRHTDLVDTARGT